MLYSTYNNSLMLSIKHQDRTHVDPIEAARIAANMHEYVKTVYRASQATVFDQPESSTHLSFDEEILTSVKEATSQFSGPTLRFVVSIGIGGSYLGVDAIYRALRERGNIPDALSPTLLFLSTVDARALNAIAKTLLSCESENEFVICVISKSGKTTEVIANAEALFALLHDRFTYLHKRVVIISDADSPLAQLAQENDQYFLPLPTSVGGRFSVFTPVGLFPLALVNIRIEDLLHGSRTAVEDTQEATLDNPALYSAIATFVNYKNGCVAHNSFFFAPELEGLGAWYRQLMGESLGKSQDLNGENGEFGILPIVSIGSQDLHSVAQLFLGGPRNIFTNIIRVRNRAEDTPIPQNLLMSSLVANMEGKSMNQLMDAITTGVENAYKKSALPYLTLELAHVDETSLGYYMQFRMIEMMYLAKLINVNAFDQPSVESYKQETREVLASM